MKGESSSKKIRTDGNTLTAGGFNNEEDIDGFFADDLDTINRLLHNTGFIACMRGHQRGHPFPDGKSKGSQDFLKSHLNIIDRLLKLPEIKNDSFDRQNY